MDSNNTVPTNKNNILNMANKIEAFVNLLEPFVIEYSLLTFTLMLKIISLKETTIRKVMPKREEERSQDSATLESVKIDLNNDPGFEISLNIGILMFMFDISSKATFTIGILTYYYPQCVR